MFVLLRLSACACVRLVCSRERVISRIVDVFVGSVRPQVLKQRSLITYRRPINSPDIIRERHQQSGRRQWQCGCGRGRALAHKAATRGERLFLWVHSLCLRMHIYRRNFLVSALPNHKPHQINKKAGKNWHSQSHSTYSTYKYKLFFVLLLFWVDIENSAAKCYIENYWSLLSEVQTKQN